MLPRRRKVFEATADLPGIDQKDIEINLADGILTLKAEHKVEKEEKDEKKHYHLVERSFGTFMRSFELPFEADTDKVEATFDKGVLKISVPRSAAGGKPGQEDRYQRQLTRMKDGDGFSRFRPVLAQEKIEEQNWGDAHSDDAGPDLREGDNVMACGG